MGYRVTGQRQTSIIGDNGNVVHVWEVTYKTDDGIVGRVDVPTGQYTADNVDKAIRANVEVHDAVAQLGR